jgi:Polyketide cyclase / dehydrase and lipid transport
MSSLLVSRTARVEASPPAIFALLADPAQHHLIDGSGTVTGARDVKPERLKLGSKFGMSMKLGVPYRITNTVVEFVEGTSITWQHFGKHTWRYQLEPIDGGTATSVTETFDGTTSRLPWALSISGAGKRNAKAIEATLIKLQRRFPSATAL